MIVSLIVALDRKGAIGKDGGLPWRLSADLRNFKALTSGHHLIVGRKTWESIGRPLAGRKLVIITRSRSFLPANCPDCAVVASLQAALDLARRAGETEAFIGGGGEIFAQSLRLANKIYLTEVDTDAAGDVFFPELDPHDWIEVATFEHPADEKNEHRFTVRTLERVKSNGG